MPRGDCPQQQVLNEDGTYGPYCYYHGKLFAGYGTPVFPESYRVLKDGRYAPWAKERLSDSAA